MTGADGFVGRHLVRTLLDAKHEVVAACRPASRVPPEWVGGAEAPVRLVPLELESAESVRAALGVDPEAIIHLAAVAYSRDANADPGTAWNVNAGGTARLLSAVADRRSAGSSPPTVIVTSSAEVYGDGEARARVETDALRPLSPYGASKVGAEIAAAQSSAAWGLRVVIVRPFPATGPGQTNRLLPNWITALRAGQRDIEGDGTIVRDYLDVRDTAEGFAALLARGRPGETYNLSAGREVRFGELFAQLASALGVEARLVPPARPRREPPYLVGDSHKMQRHTGWRPTIPLDRTLADLIDAQTD